MKKNRALFWIGGILLILIVGIVLICTLLRVRNFEYRLLSSPSYMLEAPEEALDDFLGKSVLFLNVSDVTRELEKKVPYARVEKVEKNVSRTVVVKLTERYEFFCIRAKSGTDENLQIGENYLVTDRDLKILRVGTGPCGTVDEVDSLIEVLVPDTLFGEQEVGETLQFQRPAVADFLNAFSAAVQPYEENVFTLRQTFESIEYFNEPTETDPYKAGCTVKGRYGADFRLNGATDAVDASFAAMARIFYSEFNTMDRERMEIHLFVHDGEAVRR